MALSVTDLGNVTDLTSSNGTSSPAALSAAISSGDKVLVVIMQAQNQAITFSDDGGNDYATHAGSVTIGIINWRLSWAFVEATNAATTISAAWASGTTNFVMRAWKLAGLVSAPLDQTKTATGASTSPSSGATGTLAQADELAFEVCGIGNATSTWTAGFTNNLGQNTRIVSAGAGWKETSSTAAVTATGTLTGSSPRWAMLCLTFKAAAAAVADAVMVIQ